MTAEIHDWAETKRRLQLRWPGLPDDELEASQGERGALVALLQGRLGYARPNAEQDVDQILGGETMVPEVADAETHTGTAGPVGSTPDAGSPSSASRLNGGDGMTGTSNATDRGELPDHRSEHTAPSDAARADTFAAGMTPEGASGAGQPPGSDQERWGHGPWGWESHHEHGGMHKKKPPKVVGVVVIAGMLLMAGTLLRRRARKRSKTEQVSDQARHLLDEINERMPSVEELRDKVRSLDEMRPSKANKKELRGKRKQLAILSKH